jgi:hypothetical protein
MKDIRLSQARPRPSWCEPRSSEHMIFREKNEKWDFFFSYEEKKHTAFSRRKFQTLTDHKVGIVVNVNPHISGEG